MEFIQRPYKPGETIAAIATPPGEGGISVIRISGQQAIAVAAQVCSRDISQFISHTAHLSSLIDKEGNKIDEALVIVMKGPKSYTGEDTVELQCHGGMIASRKVLQACLDAGALAAQPGEFTFKAFMNGRLDLAQAEAVQKLIGAKNDEAFECAGKHLEGQLSRKVEKFQHDLIRLAAILEAWVDFPEEGIEFTTLEEIISDLQKVKVEMSQLLETFDEGKKLEHGISLCILGAPNAGKSSLLNALLDEERAIVTPIAGTTRDLLHEEITFGGLHFKLTDTAGIRSTSEIIEQEGIRRSRRAAEQADVVLLVLDVSRACNEEEQELFAQLPSEKTIAIWNKADLPHHTICQTPFALSLKISAKEKQGLEDLKKCIQEKVWNKMPSRDQVVITSIRHKEALTQAIQELEKVIHGLQNDISAEFLTADLRSSLAALGRMIGTNISEEILTSIFSQFCIGK